MSADDYVGRPNYVQPLPGAKCSYNRNNRIAILSADIKRTCRISKKNWSIHFLVDYYDRVGT